MSLLQVCVMRLVILLLALYNAAAFVAPVARVSHVKRNLVSEGGYTVLEASDFLGLAAIAAVIGALNVPIAETVEEVGGLKEVKLPPAPPRPPLPPKPRTIEREPIKAVQIPASTPGITIGKPREWPIVPEQPKPVLTRPIREPESPPSIPPVSIN